MNTHAHARALVKTDSESSIEVTVRRRRILLAGLVARTGEERLPRAMFGSMVGGKGYSYARERDWMGRLQEEHFEKFAIRSQGLRETAQTEGRQTVPRGRRRGRGLHVEHVEMACRREERRRRATHNSCNCHPDRGHQYMHPGGGRGRGQAQGGREALCSKSGRLRMAFIVMMCAFPVPKVTTRY